MLGLVGGPQAGWRGHVIVCGLPGVGLRIVEQLTNPAVGRAVREAGVGVLDVAGLSALSVAEICLASGSAKPIN
jgi:hypothetical protein